MQYHKLVFHLIKIAQLLLEQKLHQLNIGDEYKRAAQAFDRFTYLIKECKKLTENPELQMHQKIAEFKNAIDLRREELKREIDAKALDLIKELCVVCELCSSNSKWFC